MEQRFKTRHLEAVIALADELHYGRAAKRIGLTQSGMSRSIQGAERDANAKLFARNRSSIEITDAGRSYVEHARIALAHGERAVRSAKEMRDGAETVLRIGKSPDVDPVLVSILYSIRLPLFPSLEISIHSETASDLAHDLMSAELDLALITQPERNAKLTMTKLAETPLYIVLPREHKLASQTGIKLNEVQNEHWIVYQKRTHPLLYERITKLMRDQSLHPKRIDRILYPDEAEGLLLANRSVALLTKANALKLEGERLVARPLEEETLCLDEWIAARGDDTSRLVSEFVRAFVTRSTQVLQPSQMVLPIGKNSSPTAQCSPS
jgi:DNA-binding transcriptional LysR family regulator